MRSKDTRHASMMVGAVCLSALVACTGMVTGTDGTTNGNNGFPSPGSPGNPGGGAAGANGNSSGGLGSGGLATQMPIDPGSKLIHRLNTDEYNNTVVDVLGTTLRPGDGNWAAEETAGFDNIAAVQAVDAKQYKKYYEAAIAVATDVFANPTSKAKVVTCPTTDDAACVDGIIKATGLRIFRRPLTPEEVTTYHKVYSDARGLALTHEPALQQVLTALLASAEFLFRMEFDQDPASTAVHDLTGYELASRLSYFLWKSAPDDAMLAKSATLATTGVLSAEYDRAVADAKFERSTRGFVGQWLGINRVATHAVKLDTYPGWSPALAAAMAEEGYLYFDEFAKGSDLPWPQFLTANVNFVDATLANLYGITAPASGTQRVVNTANRSGFLGLGSFLALSSYEYRTAPTLRGRWILVNLMCSPPPDPPPGVPPLDAMPNADATDGNVRARLEAHRKNPVCASCHALMDPYGLALENFDGIGQYRDAYKNGQKVDASTVTASGVAFTGLSGLQNNLTSDPKLFSCLEDRLFTYSLGREVTPTDKPYIAQLDKAWRTDPTKASLPRLSKALVLADTFRKRHGGI